MIGWSLGLVLEKVGGDGKSTFALPNLQGAAPLGRGQGAGLSERFLGESGGSTTVTLLVPKDRHDRANGLIGTASGIAFSITSVFSGLAVGFLGMGWCVVIAIVLTALVAIHLLTIRIDEPAPTRQAEAPRIIDVRGAVRAVQLVPGLFALLLFSTFNNFLGGAFMALLDPYGLTLVSVEQWGIVLAVTSLGFVAGGLLVARRGLSARTLFAGWLDGAERLAAYQEADLFVLPSLQENFALSAAEAMALGVPVIVSDRVNLADDIRAAGAGWVSGPDPQSLGLALKAALADPGARHARGEAGRALARRRFVWSVIGRQLFELYRTLGRAREGVPVA